MKKLKISILSAIFIVCSNVAQTAAAQNETMVFTPQWTAQAQFAGYYVAEAKGFYREAGVNVCIEHPSSTQPAISRLYKNECQATTLQLCQAMEIVGDGIPSAAINSFSAWATFRIRAYLPRSLCR